MDITLMDINELLAGEKEFVRMEINRIFSIWSNFANVFPVDFFSVFNGNDSLDRQ